MEPKSSSPLLACCKRFEQTWVCRRVSHDIEMASTSRHDLLSESEASELFGDYIDEDSQTVQQVMSPDGMSDVRTTRSKGKCYVNDCFFPDGF